MTDPRPFAPRRDLTIMRCSDCGHDNRDSARFCSQCGQQLARACARCGNELGARARFCDACGTAVDAAATPAAAPPGEPVRPAAHGGDAGVAGRAERRQLTVMFCDLAGSTELSERLDPEDLRELERAYQDVCTQAVTHFDGFVARYMGDGILAYFGYPQAHENDAERAVRAGLSVVEAVARLDGDLGRRRGVRLEVRVGIATGPVVVGDLIGEGAAQESAVVGETPNLAARLQTAAEPGAVVVAQETRRLLGRVFELESLGEKHYKGFSKPVPTWRVLGETRVATRFEAAQTGGITPLVGRRHELTLLWDAWQRAAEGEGQVVLVSGEAGIGKSRLGQTLRERLGERAHHHIRWQCSPYHRDSALYPVADSLEREAGFARTDSAGDKLDKLAALLAPLEDGAEATLTRLLGSLLSLPIESRFAALRLSPEQHKAQTLAALAGRLEGLAATRAVLLAVEDLHWVDPTTLALLDELVERVATLPVLMLMTFRPQFAPSWTGLAHVAFMALNRMDQRQCAAMVQQLTQDMAVPAKVVEQIIAKTDGVPLFVEELTRTVLESGLLEEAAGGAQDAGATQRSLAIPTTLQDSLMARLDQLKEAKHVAQAGAVIGREFSLELLAAVVGLDPVPLDEELRQLEQAGLVHARGTDVDRSYVFKHALIQDAAYESLLKSDRRRLHAAIAQALETHFADKTVTEPEVLARHYTEAERHAPAADYWRRAGRRATERYANVEAIGHFQHGLAAAAGLPAGAERTALELGLRIDLVACFRLVDRYDDALATLEVAQGQATELDRVAELADVHYYRGNIYFPLGNIDGCLTEHSLAREYARAAGSPQIEARAVGGLGDAYYLRGRMKTAYEHFVACVDLCRRHGFEYIEAANQPMIGWSSLYLHSYAEAVDNGVASVEKAAAVGNPRAQMMAYAMIGYVKTELGEFADARRHLDRSLELARKLGSGNFEAAILYFTSRNLLSQDMRAEALILVRQARALSERLGPRFHGAAMLAALALASDDPQERREALHAGQALLDAGCVGHNYYMFYEHAIDMALALGDEDQALHYAAKLEAYTRPEPLPRSDFLIARARALAHYGRGERDAALTRELERLHDLGRGVGLVPALREIEAALGKAPAAA